MTGDLCPRCRNWRRAPGECFCGLCGAGLTRIRVECETAFHYAQPGASAPAKLRFFVTAPEELAPNEARLALEVDESGRRLPCNLLDAVPNPEGARVIEFAVAELASPAGPVTGRLVQLDSGDRVAGELARFGLRLPPPHLVVLPREVVLDADGVALGRAVVRLVVEEGVLAPVEALSMGEDENGETGSEIEPVALRDLPAALGARQALTVELRLARTFLNALREAPAGIFRPLQVRLAGDPQPKTIPLHFLIDSPAAPELRLPDAPRAMAGADLCLPVTLRNAGSRAIALDVLKVFVPGGDEPVPLLTLELNGETLAGGAERRMLLDLARDGPAGALLKVPGSHRLLLEQSFRDRTQPPIKAALTLTVQAERDFDQLVAIDFGTTETAVSIFSLEPGAAPVCLEIGDGSAFLPTVVAYPATGCLVGEAAKRSAGHPEAGPVRYFDNIKWQLAEPAPPELPDGRRLEWTDVAADYLRELKRRIEGHPSVAARVRSAYVTRPARFNGRAVGALLQAFRQAGIEPLEVPAGTGRTMTMSESWPSSILGLERTELAGLRRATLGETGLFEASPVGRTHGVLTIDVGGGSADFSLFQIDYHNYAKVQVDEIAFDGDHDLCGNQISDWIYWHILRPAVREAMTREGLRPDDLQVHFPWRPIRRQGVDRTRERNGLAVARSMFELQRRDGPFARVFERLSTEWGRRQKAGDRPGRSGFYEDDLFDISSDDTDKWARMQQAWEQVAYVPAPLDIEMPDGDSLTVNWPEHGLSVDFADAMADFRARFHAPLCRYLARLAEIFESQPQIERPLHVLISGRGSLFPLFGFMIQAAVRSSFGADAVRLHHVSAAMCKPITAIGACYIADIVVRERGIRFHGRIPSRLALLGDSAADRPDYRLVHPLAIDELGVDDGVSTLAYEMQRGRMQRRFDFVMIDDGEDTVPADRPRVLQSVLGLVDLPEASELSTYLVLRARGGGQLEIGVGAGPHELPEAAKVGDFACLEWLSSQTLPSTR